MTVQPNDWRLQGQGKYLQGETFHLSEFKPYRDGWEHEHCEFCGAKFCLQDDECLKEGYCTDDHYRWVCSPCFSDFRDMFAFKLE